MIDFDTDEGFRSGFVAFVGRPNSGKSTLINSIMGKKLAITSDKAQTTRHRFRAIYDTDESQIIFMDTPGIHKPHDLLGSELNKSANQVLGDADITCLFIDLTQDVGTGDEWVAKKVANVQGKKFLLLSKSDLVNEKTVERQMKAANALLAFDETFVISAKRPESVSFLIERLRLQLPLCHRWFPRDTETDQSLEILIAEFIREKILRTTRDEVPHSVGVELEDMEYVGKKKLYRISATIYVQRDSQKGILIGKGGSELKLIGTAARKDLETLLGRRVFLDLSVKVKKDWRKDMRYVRKFGCIDGQQ